MSFIKKAGAVLLAISMLPAISAFAAVSETYTDDFEGHKELVQDNDVKITSKNFYGDPDKYPSNVFDGSTGSSGRTTTILKEGGTDKSVALQTIQSDIGNRYLRTKEIPAEGTTDPVIIFTYDFNIKNNAPDDTKNIYLGGGNSSKSDYRLFKLGIEEDKWKVFDTQNTAAKPYEYTLDTWYKMETVSTSEGVSSSIIDKETGEVLIKSEASVEKEKMQKALDAVYFGTATSNHKCTIVIDNAELTVYDTAVHNPELLSASVENGATNVLRNQKLIFTFDQAIDKDSKITLKKKINENEYEDIAEKVYDDETKKKQWPFTTLVFEYDGLLDEASEYVISFGNVTNGTLSCSSEDITFTTESIHLPKDVKYSAPVQDGGMTKISLTITDSYPTFSGAVMAVAYVPVEDKGDQMVAVDIQPLVEITTGESTNVEFALGELPENAKISIILLNVENGPLPLAGGMLEN